MSATTDYLTLRAITVHKIREMILNQTLKPGERISQDDLSARLGVSRMPIREALNALETEGLVQSTPHRGAVVSPVSVEDIEELTLIRCSLEGMAANYGARKMTDDRIKVLGDILAIMARDCESMVDANEHYQRHKVFHFQVYEASGLPRVCRLIAPLWDASERYRRAGASLPGRRKQAWQEHEQLLSACVQRNGDLAQKLVTEHLRKTSTTYIEALKQMQA